MELSERRVDDVVVVDLEGELTIGNQIIPQILDTLVERGEKQIVFNMAGVSYMDSTNVGDLVVAHVGAANRGVQLKLVGMRERIQELLKMHHLIGVFDYFEDEETAIASFGG